MKMVISNWETCKVNF